MTDPIRRGATADDILSRPMIQEVIGEIEAEIVDKWRSGATAEDREAAFS